MKIDDVLKDHEQEIIDKENVTTIFSGYKIKNGQKTDEMAIVIGVEQKIPLENLNEKDKIPKEIDGIKTDVITIGKIKPLGTCVLNPGPACHEHGHPYNPLISGISIGYRQLDDTNTVWITGSGTLGSMCIDKTDNSIVALTNNHVVGNVHKNGYDKLVKTISGRNFSSYSEIEVVNQIMYQPSYGDNGNVFNPMMKVIRADGFKTNNAISDTQYVDAALLKMDNINTTNIGALKLSNETGIPFKLTQTTHEHTGFITINQELDLIENVVSQVIITTSIDDGHSHNVTVVFNSGKFQADSISGNHGHDFFIFGNSEKGPYKFAFPNETTIGTIPYKSGRTTGMVNFGEVISVNGNTYVAMTDTQNVYFANQIFVYGDLDVSAPGDSGSGVYLTLNDETKIIGLLFAGGDYGSGKLYVCNPIWRVADTMDIKAWNGNIILNDYQGVQIMKNNQIYDYKKATLYKPTHL